ncbi:ATP-dependent metallopeptidase FtsH/Yme1/Tma family protein [Ktedonosporobacter rubrisoli]|uniref:ATP-dependent zinc metalloprotease FtsH n=1 Tax=Ktedonosporobacter rubrisoli TaxID=2509675 RepID=A0A4P6JW60_KTERU|nr:ATP-dependent zinc metalloprotease FtsH [Ktedonosporobacter rubrisoli]QBD79917.1 ATP-dependent metallopeptidase FtsH/Yme1/Tma family protein [Ktedonosporobacter rubrisoli]
MDRQPGNMHWLQNSNDRQQFRPGTSGRPNGPGSPKRPTNTLNRWLFLIVAAMLVVYIFSYFNSANNANNAPQAVDLPYNTFYQQIDAKNVKSATFVGQSDIMGELNNPIENRTQYHVVQLPNGDDQLPQKLINSGAVVSYKPPPDNGFWLNLLITFLPWVFLIGLFVFFSRRASQGQQGIFSFGKSKAKLILEDRPSTTFADVAGVDESKYELQEVVEFLKTPQKFQRLGGKIPRGVLLVGPPGTGKTLLARAVAGEAGVPFFSMSGSEFVEVLVGVGASRVRDLFDQAKKAAPSIIFIDEIDAVGRQRGSSINTNDEREQTLNQLLVEMDGFDNRQAVVVIGATNRPDGLDQALLRPGRFDRRVTVDRPDWNGRLAILKIHSRNVPLSADVDLVAVARSTTGMVGADLANLVNEAALLAARRNLDRVPQRCFDEALDKILLGAERPLVLSDEDLNVTAYHEGGHALTGLICEGTDPVTKVTIVPRGQALGVTMYTPLDDRYNYSKEYLTTQIVTALGGRAAEQVVFNRVTTGAENDLQRVTAIARQMVTRWGMSERLGVVSFSERESPFAGGGNTGAPTDYSEDTAELIDDEVQRIVRACYEKAINILTTYRPSLDRIAQELRRHETIDAKQLHTILEETGAPLASSQLQPQPNQPAQTLAPPPPVTPPAPPEVS